MLSNQRSQYLVIPPAGATNQYGTYLGYQTGINILTAPIYMGPGLERKITITKASSSQELDVTLYGKDYLGNEVSFDIYSPGASNGEIADQWISVIERMVVNIAPAAGFSVGGAISRGFMQCEGNHTSHMILNSSIGDTWTMKGATFEAGEAVQTGGGTPQNTTFAFFPISAALTNQGSNLPYLTELTIPLGLFMVEQNGNDPTSTTVQWYMGQKVFR